MLNKKIIIVLLTALFLTSCLSTGEIQYFSYSQSGDEPSSDVLDDSVVLPEAGLFVSAPYFSEESGDDSLDSDNIILPEYEIPEEETPVPPAEQSKVAVSETETQLPEITIGSEESSEPDFSENKSGERESVIDESTPLDIQDLQEPEERVAVLEPVLPVDDKVQKSMEFNPGEDIRISLDREGWIFDRDESSDGIVLKERQFNNGKTHFLFGTERGGSLILLFVLQNSETGEDEKIAYNLETPEEAPVDELPVIIEANYGEYSGTESQGQLDSDLSVAISEGNVPGVIASIDQLTDPAGDPGTDLMLEAFELLDKQGGYDQLLVKMAENAFNLYPYDNSSAEMLFRAAQSLENPGAGQDIEKAIILFKLVRDYFPLSVYSDRSEERISYLERHFMKIY